MARHRPTHSELIDAVRRQANESTKIAEEAPRCTDAAAVGLCKLAQELRQAAAGSDEPTLEDVNEVRRMLDGNQ